MVKMWHFFLHEILNFASTEPLIYSQRSIEKQIYLLKIKQPKLGCYDKTQLRISFKDFVFFFVFITKMFLMKIMQGCIITQNSSSIGTEVFEKKTLFSITISLALLRFCQIDIPELATTTSGSILATPAVLIQNQKCFPFILLLPWSRLVLCIKRQKKMALSFGLFH